MGGVTFTPVPTPRKGQRKHLTLSEWKRVYGLACEAGLYEQTLLALIYELGLRASEPGRLRLDHCKLLHQGRLYVVRTKKSETNWRFLSKKMVSLLYEWIERAYPDTRLRRPELPLFPGNAKRSTKGREPRGISRFAVRDLVKDLCRQANVPEGVSHPHAIRHGRMMHLCEQADRKGLPLDTLIQTLAKIVGHKSAQTTLQHYIAEHGAGKRLADEVLSNALLEEGTEE